MPQPKTISVLKKRSEFLSVASARRRFVTSGFIVQVAARPPRPAADTTPEGPRYGLTASKKMVSLLAVERNRARRRLRALAAALLPTLAQPNCDYVLLAKKEILTLPFATLRADLEKAMKRLEVRG